MTSIAEKFAEHWDLQVKERQEHSPSFSPEEYTATGRAPAAYGGKRTIQWWHDFGPGMVEKYIQWHRSAAWPLAQFGGKPAVELELNFQLPGLDMPIKAFIDQVFEPGPSEFAIVDIKTGARLPETAEQLGLYKVGIEIMFGVKAQYGFFWGPDKGMSAPYDLTMYTPEYFSKLFNAAIAGVNAGAFLPVPQNNCKAWCGVARFCSATGGPEAAGVDPLSA